jgi:hypothetical protein
MGLLSPYVVRDRSPLRLPSKSARSTHGLSSAYVVLLGEPSAFGQRSAERFSPAR